MRVLNNPSLSMAWSLMQIILEDIGVPASLSVFPRMNEKDGWIGIDEALAEMINYSRTFV